MTDITTKTIVANIINTTPTIKASVISDTPTFKASIVQKGADGKEIELQVNATHIQWRLADGTWANLIALADLKGADGTNGIDGTDGLDGNGIASITLTSGDHSPGTTDTYTVTFTDATTTTFTVYNGANGTNGTNGRGIVSVLRTAGTGAAGTTDTYTITFTDATTTTFDVYNGADGAGAGDMLKSVYDTNNNNIVDNAEKVNGKTVEENVPSGAKFTDTIYTHPNHSGDVTSVADGAQTIANGAVTLAKMANINANTIIGRYTAGTGAPELLAIGSGLNTTSGVLKASIVDNLIADDTDKALSAAQGKALNTNKANIANPTFTGLITTAGQVAFPATQNPSADPNTLDDYEEGTWTPILKEGANVMTVATNAGTYTKIGRLVFITCNIQNITKSGGGNLTIEGLPFVNVNFSNSSIRFRGANLPSGGQDKIANLSSSIISLISTGASTSDIPITASDIDSPSSADITFTLSYEAS